MSLQFGPPGLLAVIVAPLLWPIAAILQLLFPVILRDQVRAYRWACIALVTESGLLTLHWLLARLCPSWVATWGPPARLEWLLAAAPTIAAAAAWWQPAASAGRPHRLEWAAFAMLFSLFGGRALVLAGQGRFEPGFGAALGGAAGIASLHLAVRQISVGPIWLTTQRVFLTALCIASAAAAAARKPPAPFVDQRDLSAVWSTFRGNPQRTGSIDPADDGPHRPRVLWRFQCAGDARVYASPVVVGTEAIVVATQTDATGSQLFNRLYRIETITGKLIQAVDLPRAGVSTPAVRGPLVVLGEGYHQDRDCSLRILDRRSGAIVGAFPSTSHVESSPALASDRVYFGAGEDGVFGIELTDDGTPRPLWHVGGDHVDAAPLVAGGTVYVGSVTGDANQPPALLALDAATGVKRWRIPAPLSAIAAPALDIDRIFYALGNGKLDRDADHPAGAIWCLNAATGDRLWQITSSASLYASPVCQSGNVFVAAGDGLCQCLRQGDGSRVWQTSLGQRVVAGPIVSGGAMFVVTERGTLVRLGAATGQVEWRFDDLEEFAAAGDVRASPVLAGGRIYLAAGGYLFCIGDRGE